MNRTLGQKSTSKLLWKVIISLDIAMILWMLIFIIVYLNEEWFEWHTHDDLPYKINLFIAAIPFFDIIYSIYALFFFPITLNLFNLIVYRYIVKVDSLEDDKEIKFKGITIIHIPLTHNIIITIPLIIVILNLFMVMSLLDNP